MPGPCPACGAALPAGGAGECPGCGRPLPAAAPPDAPAAPARAPAVPAPIPAGPRRRPGAPRTEPPRGARARGPLATGDIFARSLSAWGSNIVPFLGITFIVFLPLIVYSLVFLSRANTVLGRVAGVDALVDAAEEEEAGTARAAHLRSIQANLQEFQEEAQTYEQVQQILGSLLRALVQAALIGGVIQHLRGSRVAMGDLFSRGLARMFPAVWTAILAAVLVMLPMLPGFVVAASGAVGAAALLLLAGAVLSIVVATATYAAVPASVVEKKSGLAGIRRSFALTKGSRMPIFVVLLLLGGAAWVVVYLAQKSGDVTVVILVAQATTVLGASFGAVFSGVVYHDLRTRKEGVGVEELARVFD